MIYLHKSRCFKCICLFEMLGKKVLEFAFNIYKSLSELNLIFCNVVLYLLRCDTILPTESIEKYWLKRSADALEKLKNLKNSTALI